MSEGTNEDHRLLLSIQPQNILSFGQGTPSLFLENLNVLIGPNGSGKSNLVELIALMRATPIRQTSTNADLRGVVRRGGGVAEWIWKRAKIRTASIELSINNPDQHFLVHRLKFRADEQGFRLLDERIEDLLTYRNRDEPTFYYVFGNGRAVAFGLDEKGKRKERRLPKEGLVPELSVLAQLRDPEVYPELSYLATSYERVRIYREWAFGRNTVFREPQRADMRNDRLEEDFSNLGLFLNRLRRTPKAKAALLDALRDLYEGVTDFDVSVEGGTVQVFFTEGDFTIPATRLSDGTLRYLCLMAILCDPDPPPLICIEEPELGLHPDILPNLADKLVSASQRTQLIVTTHSDILVDALTERPGAVVVCEKHEGQTTMRRLAKEELAAWLDKYRLGELWIRGQLGGKRW